MPWSLHSVPGPGPIFALPYLIITSAGRCCFPSNKGMGYHGDALCLELCSRVWISPIFCFPCEPSGVVLLISPVKFLICLLSVLATFLLFIQSFLLGSHAYSLVLQTLPRSQLQGRPTFPCDSYTRGAQSLVTCFLFLY